MRRMIFGALVADALSAGFAFGQGLQQQLPIPLPPTMGGTNAVASSMVCDGDASKSAANTTALTNSIATANGQKSVIIYKGTGDCYANPITISVANTHLIIDQGATLKLNVNQSLSFFLDVAASNVLIDIYGAVDGNKANQSAAPSYGNALIRNINQPYLSVDGHGVGKIMNGKAGAVFGQQGDYPTVKNLIISGNNNGDISLSGAYIVYFEGVQSPLVEGNNLLDNIGAGISINGAGGASPDAQSFGARIVNNNIDYTNVVFPAPDNTYLAISFFGEGGAPFAVVSGNYVRGPDSNSSSAILGISLDSTITGNAGTRQNSVTGNAIDGGPNNKISLAFEIDQVNAAVAGNTCKRVQTGLLVGATGAKDVTFSGNACSDVTGPFILTTGGTTNLANLTVTGNTCNDCATTGGSIFQMSNEYAANASFVGNRITFSSAVSRNVPVFSSTGTGAVADSRIIFNSNIVNSAMAANYPTFSFSGGSVIFDGNDIFSTSNSGSAVVTTATVSESTINNNRIVGFQYPWDTSLSTRTTIAYNKVGATTPAGLTAASDLVGPNITITTGAVSSFPLTGVIDASTAATGVIGQPLDATAAAGSVSLTTATPANAVSLSLTAGDWEINGEAYFLGGATTTWNNINASIGSTSATFNAALGKYAAQPLGGFVFGNSASFTLNIPNTRISVSTTTTYYLVAQASFGVSTLGVGGSLHARRVR